MVRKQRDEKSDVKCGKEEDRERWEVMGKVQRKWS